MSEPLDIAKLREVAEKATQREWPLADGVIVPADGFPLWGSLRTYAESQSNALHISTFDPPTVVALLSRLESAERRVAELEAELAEERNFDVDMS